MKFRVLLKGGAYEERTALLIRALSDLRVISGGYVKAALQKTDGSRIDGLLQPGEAASAVMPYDGFAAREYSKAELLSSYDGIINEIVEKEMGFVCPILGDELASADAVSRLEEVLGGEIPLMAVLAARGASPDADEYDRILSKLEGDEQTLLVDLEEHDGSEALRMLRDWAETVLDWSRHKKFDPQMKLRARKRKPSF